jgi:4-azaleucine resistance transporter AzlC
MIYGVLALSAGIPPFPAQAMSAVIFAGSSQILVTQLVHTAAPWSVIVLTVVIVNLRHALYSASIAPYFQKLRPAWKLLLSYLLTDEAYAVSIVHFQEVGTQNGGEESNNTHWYFLGAGLALLSSWQISTAAGIFLGSIVPENWSLDFTLALTFIALVVPNLKDGASLVAALTAGFVALLVFGLPYKLGLILAGFVGILGGMAYDAWHRKQLREGT